MVTDLSFCEDNARPRTRISAGNENIVSGRKSRKMEQEINTTQTTRPWGQKKKNGKRDNWLRELSFTGRVNKDSASERQRKSNTLSEKCTSQKKEKAKEGKWKESNQIKTSLLIQCYFSSLQSLSSPRLSYVGEGFFPLNSHPVVSYKHHLWEYPPGTCRKDETTFANTSTIIDDPHLCGIHGLNLFALAP